MEEFMSANEVGFLVFVISAFVTFGVMLAWASRH
jgi:hypothetical protein